MVAPRPRLTPQQLRRAAVLAGCDPRTVRHYITGRSVYSTTRERVEQALRELGLATLVRADQP